MYSQFFKIGEVLEYMGWKLSDVVHAQVTVETKDQLITQFLTDPLNMREYKHYTFSL